MTPDLAAAFNSCADAVTRWRDPGPILQEQQLPSRESVVDAFERLMWNVRWSPRSPFVAIRRIAGLVVLALIVAIAEYLFFAALPEGLR